MAKLSRIAFPYIAPYKLSSTYAHPVGVGATPRKKDFLPSSNLHDSSLTNSAIYLRYPCLGTKVKHSAW